MANVSQVDRRRWKDNYFYSGNREKAIQRDGFKCVMCGISRDEHKSRWGKDITVDHIDGNGVMKPKNERNNDLANLQTLCFVCHGFKDGIRKLTPNRAVNVMHLKGSMSASQAGRLYGISKSIVVSIWAGHRWKLLLEHPELLTATEMSK